MNEQGSESFANGVWTVNGSAARIRIQNLSRSGFCFACEADEADLVGAPGTDAAVTLADGREVDVRLAWINGTQGEARFRHELRATDPPMNAARKGAAG